tara:strand:+ start:74 stop:205 length:132 start_codon:yes stop_codon:yes gene_type:complete
MNLDGLDFMAMSNPQSLVWLIKKMILNEFSLLHLEHKLIQPIM